MEDLFEIKCPDCGGAMRSDQKSASYVCPFCGSSTPWTEENYYRALPVRFRHRPVQRIDGLVKLGHVDVMTEVPARRAGVLGRDCRLCSVGEKLARWDPATAAALAGSFRVSLPCPFCGAEITGDSTQNVFECGFCGGKLGAAEALRPGAYRKEFVMGVGAQNVPGRAIPFSVTPAQARSAADALARAHPADFAGQDPGRRIAETMEAVFIPFSLADLSVKALVRSDRGEFTVYQEIADWPARTPRCTTSTCWTGWIRGTSAGSSPSTPRWRKGCSASPRRRTTSPART